MYREEFLQALDRTRRLGAKIIYIDEPSSPRLDAHSVSQLQEMLGHLVQKSGIEILVANCVVVADIIVGFLRHELDIPAQITIGHVWNGNRYLYEHSENFYAELIRNQSGQGNLEIHAWATIEQTLEIVDGSLPTSYAVINDEPKGLGDLILGQSDDLNNMSYHPMIVGEDFLVKSGSLLRL